MKLHSFYRLKLDLKPTSKSLIARVRAQAGFTLVEMLQVVGVIVILLALLTVAFGPVRTMVYRVLCVNNQSAVQDAVKIYAQNNDIDQGGAVASNLLIGAGLLVPVAPVCRNGGTYSYTGTVPARGVRYASCSVAADAPSAASLATW
jgi:prepilin-type N-terminal cleavage/methylation domain-containing protein